VGNAAAALIQPLPSSHLSHTEPDPDNSPYITNPSCSTPAVPCACAEFSFAYLFFPTSPHLHRQRARQRSVIYPFQPAPTCTGSAPASAVSSGMKTVQPSRSRGASSPASCATCTAGGGGAGGVGGAALAERLSSMLCCAGMIPHPPLARAPAAARSAVPIAHEDRPFLFYPGRPAQAPA